MKAPAMTRDNPVKPSEILEAAALKIEPEGAWTQGHFALDAEGKDLPYGEYDDPSRVAVCHCINGAIYAVSGHFSDHYGIADFVRQATGWDSWLPGWNDDPDRTQAEVVSALRKAAALAREAGR